MKTNTLLVVVVLVAIYYIFTQKAGPGSSTSPGGTPNSNLPLNLQNQLYSSPQIIVVRDLGGSLPPPPAPIGLPVVKTATPTAAQT